MVIENQKQLLQAENEKRKREAQVSRRNLKVHRLQCENIETVERSTIHIAGWDVEEAVQSWKLEGSLKYGNLMKKIRIAELSGSLLEINFFPPPVRQKLCYVWINELTPFQEKEVLYHLISKLTYEKKQEVFDFLKEELKKK
jgi:hypothetical protein